MGRLSIERSGTRTVQIDGRELLLFGGCNYLGLHHHPAVLEAAREGLARYGLSSGGSRETTGNTRAHEELEEELAWIFGAGGAVLLPAGYLANLAAAQALAGSHPAALVDSAAHASVRDALAATATEVEVYEHAADFEPAREALRTCARGDSALWTDGVYPSAGHVAPVADLRTLAGERGAALVVDDCHGFGVLGDRGLGAAEGQDLRRGGLVLVLTFSKALGCQGGAVLGSAELVETLRAHSRAYLGSTPMPPALACATREALGLLIGEPERLGRLRTHARRVHAHLVGLGQPAPTPELPVFALVPASPREAERWQALFAAAGILVPSIEYPGGPAPRYLRGVVTAEHTEGDLERLEAALTRALAQG